MRKLDGVVDVGSEEEDDLKKYSLLFDKVYLPFIAESRRHPKGGVEIGIEKPPSLSPELEYLYEKEFLKGFSVRDDFGGCALNTSIRGGFTKDLIGGAPVEEDYLHSDFTVRTIAGWISTLEPDVEVVPVYRLAKSSRLFDRQGEKLDLLRVATAQLPIPDETTPWEYVFDFRQEMHDKQWHFRRFLNSLATKKQSEAEVRDDIEWTLNEYTKAMKIHHLKAGNSFFEVYVIPVIELAEDLAKFNWTKIAKGALSVKKRQVELMEAEMKAPGRECAYVFEAQKRFGGHAARD